MEEYTVVSPSFAYKRSYNDYIEELGDEERYPMPMDLPHQDFPALVQTLYDYEAGKNLPDGLVPNSTYWLVTGQKLVGVSSIRHYLNDSLTVAGGHFGIGIRPSYRNKKLGILLLRESVKLARHLGIGNIHIHCYTNNKSSVKMIEACNGQLDSEIILNGKSVSRYLIFNTQ